MDKGKRKHPQFRDGRNDMAIDLCHGEKCLQGKKVILKGYKFMIS
jgi:hypothetical protein